VLGGDCVSRTCIALSSSTEKSKDRLTALTFALEVSAAHESDVLQYGTLIV